MLPKRAHFPRDLYLGINLFSFVRHSSPYKVTPIKEKYILKLPCHTSTAEAPTPSVVRRIRAVRFDLDRVACTLRLVRWKVEEYHL
jgi:hypothetical protein